MSESTSPWKRAIPIATIALSVVAMVASAMLLVDYIRPSPVYCGADGGCAAIRQTAYATPLGIPLPAIGVVAFAAHLVLALVPGGRARLVGLGWACATGLVAAGLILIQKSMGQICVFCMVADTSALGLAVLAVVRVRAAADPPAGWIARVAGGGTGLVAVIVPVVYGVTRPPPPPPPPQEGPLPESIRLEIESTPPGQITVVDFADFECPWCRKAHVDLTRALERRKGQVRVVRKHVPLSIHGHAKLSARAALCAEAQSRGEPMAELLFTTPPKELTVERCEGHAVALGADREKYRACVADPKTDERIKEDRAFFEAANCKALPTMFIGEERIDGYKGPAAIEEALARAAIKVAESKRPR